MRKIKPVIQKDLKDCGVCSMEYIINYYGGYIPLEKLREDTLTSSDGTSIYHIVYAFQKWGFDASGVLVENIKEECIKMPLIAHLKLKSGLLHFVVIKKITKDTIYLMDPGVGNRKMKIEEFMELFTGYVVIVYPRSEVIKMDKGITIKKLFLNIINKEKFLMFKIVSISFLFTILLILSSYYFKVGSNLISSNRELFRYLIYSFGLVIFLKVLTEYIRSYYENRLNNLVDVYIYPDFLNHLFNLPLKNVKSRTTGEIISRVNELGNIKDLFSDIFVFGILDSSLMIISFIVLYIINKNLSKILLLFIIIYFILGIFISKITYKKVLENIDYQTEFNSVLLESVEMIDSVKNLNVINIILNKIEKVLAKFLYNNYLFNEFFNKSSFFKNLIIESCFFTINSVGFWLILKNKLLLIDLITFNMLLSYCIDPVKNVISLIPKYNYIKASFSKITEFINIDPESIIKNDQKLQGDIIFKNVYYSYNNYNYILNGLNITIKYGEHVLLNGSSGSGKSTVCKLIYQENIPSKGEILINNINLNDIEKGIIKDNILYVSQNEKLFTGTIRENILLERKVNDEYFHKICSLCEVEEIVSKKNMRYDTLIEPSSKNISGGEAQRIILARGLLKSANYIILDEALSEVDYNLECKIIKNICAFFKDKTIIYISHKNQTHNFKSIINLEVKNELL